MKYLFAIFIFSYSFLFAEIVQIEGKGYLEIQQNQRILHLKGSSYDMGYQHGKLLKDLIQENIKRYVKPLNNSKVILNKVSTFLKNLDAIINHIPKKFLLEMQGLADGADVDLTDIIIMNIFPEMFHCSGITLSDKATNDGSLYHVRVLDYSIGKNLQDTACLMIVEPENAFAFVNVSYAGFIGSVTGMNQQQISVGEIGGDGYGLWEGVPMSFLIREVLEKAKTLKDAWDIFSKTPRTCEYYYVVADGKNNNSIGIYATSSQIQKILPGENYAAFALDKSSKNTKNDDKYFFSPTKIESSSYQTLFYNKNLMGLLRKQPNNCITLTGFSHPERYPILIDRISKEYGKVDVYSLQEIIKLPVARTSNLHNAIFHPSTLDLWVSHADENNQPACNQKYYHFNLDEQLKNTKD
jgi:isopenicillin-N N-acyltransferase-like protein